MTVAQLLARHAVDLAAQWPSDAGGAVDDAIVDWFAVTFGGSGTAAPTALGAAMAPLTGSSRLIGTAHRAPAPIAALINGTAAHALELDDIYAPGTFHPGAPTIAAALAVADHVDATVADLRTAVVVGYEVGCRVARDLGPAHYANWHTTGTAGSIGAAAAASTLLHTPADQFAHALSLAATMSAGLQQTFRRDAAGKPLHSGNAAHAGVVAALCAAGGVTGAPDVFEGQAGLSAATGAPTDWVYCRTAFDEALAIEQITVKPYPCCGHTFAPIEAALTLRGTGVEVADIRDIAVHTYQTALAVAGNTQPRTPHERRFSIPFVVAQALAQGQVTGDSFAAESRIVQTLMPRITLSVDDTFERRFPERRGARLVTTTSNNRYEHIVDDRPGSPENPLAPNAIDLKFRDNASATLGERTDEALYRLRGSATFIGDLLTF